MSIRSLIALLCCLFLLCGCAAQGKTETQTETEQMTVQSTTSTQSEPTAYDEMVNRSLLNIGNAYRLQQKIRAAREGEDITIAYIGGSITEGLDVKPTERYVTLSSNEFEATYANGGTVTCINAGLSGTPSNLGVLRVQRDVLAYDPDIVFIEFAVNDAQDFQQKQCFESLVRTILEHPSEPAVVLIFNRTENGYTCQNIMGLTGMFYSLPMLSVVDAITPELDEGRMTWRDYSNDTVHPNADGHRMIADFIANLMQKADEGTWDAYAVPETKQYKAPFANAVLVTPDDNSSIITSLGSFEIFRGNRTGFAKQWRAAGTEGLCFQVTANAVFVIFQRNKTENMGAADVYVNGEKVMTLEAKQEDGWGDPWSQMIVKTKTVETFDIEIRPAEGYEDKLFDIYGIAYCVNES